ncbi:MAG: hypothetical protein HRU10_13290 [Opitutales bacterium]|nr:hypothetical protein [Opitutales bacterium]
MLVEDVKKELRQMEVAVLQELTSYILQLMRQQDPGRKKKVAETLDSPKTKWVSLDDMDKRLAGE